MDGSGVAWDCKCWVGASDRGPWRIALSWCLGGIGKSKGHRRWWSQVADAEGLFGFAGENPQEEDRRLFSSLIFPASHPLMSRRIDISFDFLYC